MAENSVVTWTFCKMDLGSLVMHSISKLPSRMHGCGLWRGAVQGPPSLELCDAPCEDTWPKSCPSLGDTPASHKFVSETRQSCILGDGCGVGPEV